MAENNKTVKLYTRDVVAATSSKGNQEKWHEASNDSWYKLDRVGFEALAEAMASEILIKYSNIETELGYSIVPYYIDTVEVHKGTRIASVSPNFLKEGQSIQTAYHILKRVLGPDYQKILADEKTIPNRLKKIVDTIEQASGLRYFGEYLTLLFEVDALIGNEDRHLNNIAIIEENGVYSYCPLFDNGEGFMLDNVKYPFDVETKGLMKHLRAKPFNCRFGTALSAARDLYGSQLKIRCDLEEIEKVMDKYLEWYQPMFRPFLKERVMDVLTLQMKKHFKGD